MSSPIISGFVIAHPREVLLLVGMAVVDAIEDGQTPSDARASAASPRSTPASMPSTKLMECFLGHYAGGDGAVGDQAWSWPKQTPGPSRVRRRMSTDQRAGHKWQMHSCASFTTSVIGALNRRRRQPIASGLMSTTGSSGRGSVAVPLWTSTFSSTSQCQAASAATSSSSASAHPHFMEVRCMCTRMKMGWSLTTSGTLASRQRLDRSRWCTKVS
ncbi:hypothetical protein ATK17_1622 [Branchiibius hedensis]|uniref:Uncharacterized protein n=1 Tax=Branchiibius hedensis TaxID=672460 RepID=A0A2Y8ZSN6_9MICO|nr:hypothetical protein ATK17_1622 [Branchiibius hedensis]SSA34308.1 hypothetical protein SAMN04489750_1622 [Branchiibius hedensis]